MKPEESLRREIRAALEPIVRPAPRLTDQVMARIQSQPAPRQGRLRSVVRGAGVLAGAALVAVLGISLHAAATRTAQHPRTNASVPVQVIVAPGRNVAWLQGQNDFVGVDPQGHIVRRIQAPSVIRSIDGNELFAVWSPYVDVYSAAEAMFEHRITRRGTGLEGDLSSDGNYLALLDVKPDVSQLELIDLRTGRSVGVLSLGSTLPNSGPIFVRVSPSANRIYAFANFWTDTAIDVVGFDGSSLRLLSHAVNGQGGHVLPHCDGMETGQAAPVALVQDGSAVASFCPGTGTVSWFDLNRLTITKQFMVPISNPFWVSPAFSRDRSTLVLHEGGTGRIEVINLESRTIVRSTKLSASSSIDPLRWMADRVFAPAYAGGIPRTVVLSPDGTRLYAVSIFGYPGGLWTVKLPDLQVQAHKDVPDDDGSIWLSGDGQTIYLLNNGGTELSVVHPDGTKVATISLAATGYDFLQ